MRTDRMNPMAIGADGRHAVASSNGLTMDTLGKLLFDLLVAFRTSGRNIELEDG